MKRKWRWCHEDFDRNPLDTEVLCLPWHHVPGCSDSMCNPTIGSNFRGAPSFSKLGNRREWKILTPFSRHRTSPQSTGFMYLGMIFDVNWKDWLQRSFIVRIGQVECSDSFLSNWQQTRQVWGMLHFDEKYEFCMPFGQVSGALISIQNPQNT